jgi:hypothetical protein
MTLKPPGALKKIAGALAAGRDKASSAWQPAEGAYPRLAGLDPRTLAAQPGLYLIWHLGVRPQWLRAGFSRDLGSAVAVLAEAPEITVFAAHDGPYFAWRPCAPGDAPGLVNFLTARLTPALQGLVLACDVPIDVAAPAVPCALPPGTEVGAR